MPRSKTQISKLPKDLREPIEFGRPSLLWSEAESDAWFKKRCQFVGLERTRKLFLLMDELKITGDSFQTKMAVLVMTLAKNLYPGFSTTLDAKRPGRPRRADGNQLPPQGVLIMIDGMLKEGMAKTDLEACKIWLGYNDENKRFSRSELDKKAKSLASVISTLRSLGRKKAANKVN